MRTWNQIQRPDLVQRIQAFFGLRQAHVAPTLGSEILPVAVVADLSREGRTGKFTGGSTVLPESYAVSLDVAAVLGQFARIKVRNPAGSGHIIRIRYLDFNLPSAPGQIEVSYSLNDSTDLAGVDLGVLVDTVQQPPSSTAFVSGVARVTLDTNAAKIIGSPFFYMIDKNYLTPDPWQPGMQGPTFTLSIDEGHALLIQSNVVNQRLAGNLQWTDEHKAD